MKGSDSQLNLAQKKGHNTKKKNDSCYLYSHVLGRIGW